MQKDHKNELWNYLKANPGWHTSRELAVVIGVSVRSIKRYAKDLADISAIFVSSMGYKVNQKKIIDSNNSQQFMANYESIKRILVNELVQTTALNIYDLSNRFYLSESTLIKLLKQIQIYVTTFDLKLIHNGNEWLLLGKEMDKRRVISDVLYKESEQTFIGIEMIRDNFPDIDVENIANILKRLTIKENIYLNVFDFNNILLHITIATHRIKNGYQSQDAVSRPKISPLNLKIDSTFSSTLIDMIEVTENVNFSNEERKSLILVIQFSTTRQHGNLEDTIQPETKVLVDNLIEYVNLMLNIDLRVLNFREQFAIHIQRLLARSAQGYVERNPMTVRIRESSPIIYECAVLISNRLKKLKRITIEDDEIAYIAMHIGNAVSEYINDLHKLYVVVLLPDYQNNVDNFISRLERLFSQDIVIGKIVYTPEQLEKGEYPRKIDFIIQVNSEYILPNVIYTNVSQFLTQIDYDHIDQLINDIKHNQNKNNFTNNIRDFFPPDNFSIIHKLIPRNQLFEEICDKLVRKKVVTNKFTQQLIERENMSSTAFGRVAIPHSMQMSALKTQGYIVLAPIGVKWGKKCNKVNLIFLLAVNKDNKSSYRDIFDDLSQILVDPKNIAKLIKTTNYEEFICKLTDLL